VLEAFLRGGLNLILCFIVIFSTCLTAIYRGWLIYGVLFSSISFSSGGPMVANIYLSLPCRILGFGALFGGMLMQSMILDFNINFEVCGLLKIIPISCVVGGIGGLLSYVLFLKKSLYSGRPILVLIRGYDIVKSRAAKMWFIPMLSRDSHTSNVLNLRKDVKGLVEDGYLEHSLGSDGV